MLPSNHDSRTPIYIPEDIWLSEQEYATKTNNHPLYDFCSYCPPDGEHKGMICATMATRVCRLENAPPMRFRCEICPLHAEDAELEDAVMVLTPSSDSKLGRVSKHLNSCKRSSFWANTIISQSPK